MNFHINGLVTWSLVRSGHTSGLMKALQLSVRHYIGRNTGIIEIRRKDNEYHYKILQTADRYFGEAKNRYKRSIVTNVYKNPEELFDDHSYRKGKCVLHMFRHYIGEESFRRGLKLYLERNSYGAVETDDLRQVLEEASGMSLQLFFNQWLCTAGHPELGIEYSLVEKGRKGEEKVNYNEQI